MKPLGFVYIIPASFRYGLLVPALAHNGNNDGYNGPHDHNSKYRPPLAKHQHLRDQRPDKDLNKVQPRSHGDAFQCLGLVLGINDAQQHEADGEHAGEITIAEDGVLEPTFLHHLVPQRDDADKDAEKAAKGADEQGQPIFNNDGHLDGCNSKKYQIIGSGAGDAGVDAGVHMGVNAGLAQAQEENQRHQVRDGEVRYAAEQVAENILIQRIAAARQDQHQGQVVAEGVQRDRGDCVVSHGLQVFFGDQAGFHVAIDIFEVLDVTGNAFLCAPFDKDEAAEHAGQNAYGGKCHAQITGFRPAQFRKGAANSGCGAVSTGEARCHQDAKALVDAGNQSFDNCHGQEYAHRNLDEEDDKAVHGYAENALRRVSASPFSGAQVKTV